MKRGMRGQKTLLLEKGRPQKKQIMVLGGEHGETANSRGGYGRGGTSFWWKGSNLKEKKKILAYGGGEDGGERWWKGAGNNEMWRKINNGAIAG